MKTRILGLLLAVAMAVPSVATAAGHRPIIYSGELVAENGLPFTGSVEVSVKAWDTPEMGNEIWSQDVTTYDVMNGVLDIELGIGDQAPLMAILAGGTEIWLSFTIDGETLSPRQEMTAHPYAAVAGNAQRLGGMQPSMFQLATDTVDPGSLPTDGIGQISNGALSNQFQNVTVAWGGSSADILDSEPISPPDDAMAMVNTGEGEGSYLTDVLIHTNFALNFASQIQMVLTPPASSGVGPITLIDEALVQGEYDQLWTLAEAPELGGLINQQLQGTWTLVVRDLDNDAVGSPAVGVLNEFEVLYDVVRADHLVHDGRLDVTGNLNVAGDLRVEGRLFRTVPMHVTQVVHNHTGDNFVEVPGRRFDFMKHRTDTKLLIHWNDNLRCNGGSSWSGCEWRVRVDDLDCSAPAHMTAGYYSSPTDNNLHIPHARVMTCTQINGANISAGMHSISVWVRSANSANSWTGWGLGNSFATSQQTTAVITVEEVY